MIDEKERSEKIALSEMKEKISMFLYKNYIDFERDKGVIIQGTPLKPSFYLNKHGIVIECFKTIDAKSQEFVDRVKLYIEDGVKIAAVDLQNLASRTVEQALREQLPRLGCTL